MNKKRYNYAQLLLMAIGGTAALVGGYDGHYYADNQTPKKGYKRPRKGRGDYGAALMVHFATKRKDGLIAHTLV